MQPKTTDESGFNAQGKMGACRTSAPPAAKRDAINIQKETLTGLGMGRVSLSGMFKLQKNAARLVMADKAANAPKRAMPVRPCDASLKK